MNRKNHSVITVVCCYKSSWHSFRPFSSNSQRWVLAVLWLLVSSVVYNVSAGGVRFDSNPTGLQIVTLRKDVDLDGLIKEMGLSQRHHYRHALHGFTAKMSPSLIAKLKQDARVVSIEPDGRVFICSQTPSDGFIRMGVSNFPVAHINGQDNRINVDVAVLDTGIQLDHPDLNVVQGVDVTGSGQNGNDDNGHGTHVAGIIGALDNNIGVVGVAPGVRLWSVKVIGSDGTGSWSDFIAGCDYILLHTNQIEVVNCSLASDGSPIPYNSIHQSVTNLVNAGVVFVAATGNFATDIFAGSDSGTNGNAQDIVPAAFPEVMAITAMDPIENTFTYYGDYSDWPHVRPKYVNSPGAAVDVTEPGVNILSTYTNSSYVTLEGTSMACGFASGLVSLYIAANGRATNAQGVYMIRQALVNSGQAQSNWGVTYTYDPDLNKEPLGIPFEGWVPKPAITSATMTTNGLQINFQTVPGYTYTVQFTESIKSSNQWTPLASTNGAGSLVNITIADSTPGLERFYRVLRQPTP